MDAISWWFIFKVLFGTGFVFFAAVILIGVFF